MSLFLSCITDDVTIAFSRPAFQPANRCFTVATLKNGNFHPIMTTYLELKAQAVVLAQQIEEARFVEVQDIIAAIKQQIDEYGITPEQLFGRQNSGAIGTRAPVAPKYRDPKSGATWSGRGKPPKWIANMKNRDRFLISSTQ